MGRTRTPVDTGAGSKLMGEDGGGGGVIPNNQLTAFDKVSSFVPNISKRESRHLDCIQRIFSNGATLFDRLRQNQLCNLMNFHNSTFTHISRSLFILFFCLFYFYSFITQQSAALFKSTTDCNTMSCLPGDNGAPIDWLFKSKHVLHANSL